MLLNRLEAKEIFRSLVCLQSAWCASSLEDGWFNLCPDIKPKLLILSFVFLFFQFESKLLVNVFLLKLNSS